MITGFILLAIGIALSGLFSGAETGFYRAARVRLLLDGLAGNSIAKTLLWFTNNPALFVATTLVGNNLANYVVSFAIVLLVQEMIGATGHWAELAAPMLLSPFIFVYGELLPKNLFYFAPNRLLHRIGPLFLLFAAIFAPLSALLWSLAKMLESVVGQAPLRVQLTLARQELQEVLEEGHEAGILLPAQRNLAQTLFAVASKDVAEFAVPLGRLAAFRLGERKTEVQRLARRHAAPILPVIEENARNLIGYVRIVDLYLDDLETVEHVRPLMVVRENESHISALIRMQTAGEELARVVDAGGETVGLLVADELTTPLFRGR